jgi:hypothetical protein
MDELMMTVVEVGMMTVVEVGMMTVVEIGMSTQVLTIDDHTTIDDHPKSTVFASM